jgi:hypothetical protein
LESFGSEPTYPVYADQLNGISLKKWLGGKPTLERLIHLVKLSAEVTLRDVDLVEKFLKHV